MNLSKYKVSQINERRYWFISSGRNGHIPKIVFFQKTIENDIFNLAMGDYIDGKIDYKNLTNNGDTAKVLATITTIVEHYRGNFNQHSIIYNRGYFC